MFIFLGTSQSITVSDAGLQVDVMSCRQTLLLEDNWRSAHKLVLNPDEGASYGS